MRKGSPGAEGGKSGAEDRTRRGAAGCWVAVGAIAAASLAMRLALAARVGLFQDEVLYWWLAGDSGLSFSPQPPGIALLVRGGEALLGQGAVAVRAGPLAAGTLSIILAAVVAGRFYGSRAAVWAAALFGACPLLAAVGSVCTPDAPVVCMWLLFVAVAWRAVEADRLGWWVASGVVLALGGYTKYMMALAVPCAVVGLLATERRWRWLARPGPWVAAGVAALLFVSGFVAWNAPRGWPSVRYHLSARHRFEFDPSRLGVYLAAHAGAISPVLWGAVFVAFGALWRGWRRRGSARAGWLLSFGLLPVLFFLPPSVLTERHLIRVQWDLIGYATGIVAVAGVVAGGPGERRRRALGVAALAMALAVLAPAAAASYWPGLAPRLGLRPLTLKMLGWPQLAAKVAEIESRTMRQPHFILTSSFDAALCLAYQRRSREGIYTIRQVHDRRYGLTRQLEAWGIDEETALQTHLGQEALFIYEYDHPDAPTPDDRPRRVWRYFEKLEPLGQVAIEFDGTVYRRFGLFRASQMLLPP